MENKKKDEKRLAPRLYTFQMKVRQKMDFEKDKKKYKLRTLLSISVSTNHLICRLNGDYLILVQDF